MTWSRVAPEHRALAALAGALAFFVPVFLLAPADDARVVVVAALAGVLTAAACWQHFPGWDVFVAGCAFTVAGRFHALLPSAWTSQALLLLPAVASWYAAARLTELFLVFPVGYEEQAPREKWPRLREELGRGSLVTLLSAGVGWLLLTLLMDAAEPLAFPMAVGLGFATGLRWPLRRPLWQVLGLLAALPAAGATARALANLRSVPPPAAADPWLLGGMLTMGALVGLWLSRWRRSEPWGALPPNRPGREASEPLSPPAAGPPAPPTPRPGASGSPGAGPKG